MKKYEHGGNIYNAEGSAGKWLDMSANINPLGMSEAVKTEIVRNIDGLIHYPDPSMKELKSAISKRYEVDVKNIIALNGAAEFFYLYFNAVRPRKVLIIEPSFSEYERAAISAQCEVEYFFTYCQDNFQINLNQLLKKIRDEKINCTVLANPNNPTGNLLKAEEVAEILKAAENVMIDESFTDFVGDEYSIKNLFNEYKNLIIVQSMTKFFAIPGLRLGFAIGDEKLIERLEQSKDVWNVNYLAQKVGAVALNDEKYIESTKKYILEEKDYICKRLKKIEDIKIFEPTANFVLIKFESERIAEELIKELREKKILLRSCENFRGLDGRYIRMAIRTRKENEKVIDLIERVIMNDKNNFNQARGNGLEC